ncbi:hypothetical protein OPV22_029223 [Ensete ventricosum]|uniref:Uncharacterized protein n=1 Tax=Ensete ventricosum TaxID=4639 RepID=A0AAV8QCN5_ENSVE|nr:hypothetical protein OPV22_029222 [Ensete ventricosum]KAJ8466671.1 hypothetical protein OPV22_029223 [Ensete ventricosum]
MNHEKLIPGVDFYELGLNMHSGMAPTSLVVPLERKTNVKDEQPKSTAGKPNVSAAKQKANKEADEDDDEESVY